jgi:hypothetical protein
MRMRLLLLKEELQQWTLFYQKILLKIKINQDIRYLKKKRKKFLIKIYKIKNKKIKGKNLQKEKKKKKMMVSRVKKIEIIIEMPNST